MRRRSLIAGAVALPFGGAAIADTFPTGPFRIIVPFGPGSATDQSARNVADGLNKAFGVPAVVENKPGANGAIAAEVAAKAKADGQTIFVCSNTAATSNVAMMQSQPYDPLKDFEPGPPIVRAPSPPMSSARRRAARRSRRAHPKRRVSRRSPASNRNSSSSQGRRPHLMS
jgi:tripartite-type tricarboxylate transporter receptor subunit TctC